MSTSDISISDSEEVLNHIHSTTALALAELDRLCTELKIRYALYGGTAIGAVRHGGFIPWDDDADVCLPRSDYERLLAEGPAIIDSRFVLLAPQLTKDYPQTFAVLGVKGTRFISESVKDRPFQMPIGVDLFPLDRTPNNTRNFRHQTRSTWVWGRLLFLRSTPRPTLSLPTPMRQIAITVTSLLHWSLRACRVSPAFLQRKWENAARKFENSGSNILADYSTRDPQRWSASMEELFPTTDITFEHLTLQLPQDYDSILTRGYGNYMEIPPPEKRVNHRPFLIDFGPTLKDKK